jgi:hypothetical protein
MAKKKLAPKEKIPANTTETIIINTSEPLLIPKVESLELSIEEFNETFKLIIKKITALQPDENEFKIGKYIFNFAYCILKNSRSRYVDEISVLPITKNFKSSNIVILILNVKGFHDDYTTQLTIIPEPDIGFTIQLDPERDFFEVLDFLSQMPD